MKAAAAVAQKTFKASVGQKPASNVIPVRGGRHIDPAPALAAVPKLIYIVALDDRFWNSKYFRRPVGSAAKTCCDVFAVVIVPEALSIEAPTGMTGTPYPG